MKKYLLIVCLISLSFSATGCIVRPAADTILSTKKENFTNSETKIGFKTVTWSQTQNHIYVNGHGFHPKEAQTYAFFWIEPYPLFQPRDIHITFKYEKSQTTLQCQIELLLDPTLLQSSGDCNEPLKYGPQILYTTTSATCSTKTFLDKLYLDLKDIKLSRPDDPNETITISGKIVAVKDIKK